MENRNNEQSPLQEGVDRKLTIAELKACPGCEHYSDEEAKEIIETLYQLAVFLFYNTSGNTNTEEETILITQKNAA